MRMMLIGVLALANPVPALAQWKKKNPVQIPSRRTKGKDLPVKIKRFTEPK